VTRPAEEMDELTETAPAEGGPAWRPVGLVAAAAGLVMLVVSWRYGFHRDEFYYLVAGRHPAWGYDDQPPLAPLWAGLSQKIAAGWPDGLQLVLLRLPSTLSVAAIVLLTGLIAAEMGATRRGQLLAAVTMAVAPVLAISGHLLSTTVFDILIWSALAFLFARWLRTRRDSLLLVAGLVTGVGLEIKTLPLVYAAGLVVGLLISGPREVFRRWQLWAGGAIAALLWAPNVWWQARHGWPQVQMTAVIRDDADWGGRAGLLPFQLLLLGVIAAVIWISGLWRLLRNPQARLFRTFGWAYLIVVVVVLATGGREYYPAGAYAPLVASGAIAADAWLARGGRGRRVLVVHLAALSAVITAALGLPIYPVAVLHATPEAIVDYDAGETAGWPTFTRQVAAVYQALDAQDRVTTVILTGNYGEAGALDHYGHRYDLPPVYSGHLAFWRWGPPPDDRTGPIILVGEGWREDDLREKFGSVRLAGKIDNGLRLDNDEQGTSIWLCGQPRRAWTQLWPNLYHL
jgi:dolichyl-phosphate-mannose-protein mannosyltransferase